VLVEPDAYADELADMLDESESLSVAVEEGLDAVVLGL
jgi:hypothetical protein